MSEPAEIVKKLADALNNAYPADGPLDYSETPPSGRVEVAAVLRSLSEQGYGALTRRDATPGNHVVTLAALIVEAES